MGSCWEAAFSLCLCFASITADSTILMSPSILTTSSSYVFLQTSQRWRYILVTSLFPSHSGTEGQFKGLLTKVCVFELLTMDLSPHVKTHVGTGESCHVSQNPTPEPVPTTAFQSTGWNKSNEIWSCVIKKQSWAGSKWCEFNRICAWPPLTLFFCCAANKWPTLWLENHRHGSVALHSYLQRNFILLSKAAGSQCDLHFTCLSIRLYFKKIPRLLLHCWTALFKSETAKIKNIYKNILLPW